VIELNGGVRTPEQAVPHLEHVDAVMIGRGAIEATWGLASADRVVFGAPDPLTSRRELVERAEQRLRAELAADPAFRPRWLLRHLLPLYAGQPGAARWRRTLAERMDEGVDGLRAALAAVTAQSC
jgi:tRNA-dihydrouridine synthase A